MPPALSILTLTLNHPDYVERLSRALHGQDFPHEFEKVLVNHGAHGRDLIDPTTALAKGYGWRVLEPGSNGSYSSGNNLAAERARGEYVLLLNDDAIPEPDFLSQLWARREEVAIQGALLLHEDRTVNHAGVTFAPEHPGLPYWPRHLGRFDPEAKWRGRGLVRSDGVTFAAVMMQRSFFIAHPLDEGYWYGFEDTDLCLRAMQNGARIGVNLNAVAIHGELGTRAGGRVQDKPNAERFGKRWSLELQAITAKHAQSWRA
jgi:GT2 family glycosyltransferase